MYSLLLIAHLQSIFAGGKVKGPNLKYTQRPFGEIVLKQEIEPHLRKLLCIQLRNNSKTANYKNCSSKLRRFESYSKC